MNTKTPVASILASSSSSASLAALLRRYIDNAVVYRASSVQFAAGPFLVESTSPTRASHNFSPVRLGQGFSTITIRERSKNPTRNSLSPFEKWENRQITFANFN